MRTKKTVFQKLSKLAILRTLSTQKAPMTSDDVTNDKHGFFYGRKSDDYAPFWAKAEFFRIL